MTHTVPKPPLTHALAGVEASDTQYRDGRAEQTRRKTLALHVRPLGLWIVVALSLAPGIWSLLGAAIRLGLKWLLDGVT